MGPRYEILFIASSTDEWSRALIKILKTGTAQTCKDDHRTCGFSKNPQTVTLYQKYYEVLASVRWGIDTVSLK